MSAASAQSSARSYSCGSTTCATYRIDLTTDTLELLDQDSSGERFGSIAAVKKWGEQQGKVLRFATNAGIFARCFVPLGLFIREGREIVPLNRDEGTGNFYLKPNGVFYVVGRDAHVVETSKYSVTTAATLATQSGPLLLIDGAVNPSFNPTSENTTIRSGVGVAKGKENFPVFAISDSSISFYDFATFFKNELGCTDALYLDGHISKMFAPQMKRTQEGGDFAAIFALFDKQAASR